MSAYYFATSALVKRYVAEVGSAWVRNVIARPSGHVIYAALIAQAEAISALQRKVRDGDLEEDRARTLFRRVTTHFAHSYVLVAITPQVVTQACELLQHHPLRAYDALQLACAVGVRGRIQQNGLPAPIFVAADDILLAAATAEGFTVDNPLLYPG
ncbi:MAG: type II toxin-antitoxin system VapC family toxin [Nitrospinae bacterium]|nr:type II toxin-antitoxin system VapC family toxin [Nitrospinota bacterium]